MGVVYFSIIPTFEPSRYCKCWIVCFYNNSGIRKLRRNKTIHGTFNLKKESRAINNNSLGVVPIEIGEKLMDQLLNADI